MGVQSEAAGCVVDIDQSLRRLGGDRQLYAELVSFVLEDAPILLSELNQAVVERDAAAVRMKAHALKGLVAGCGGVRAANAAQKVETAGEKKDLSDIDSLVNALRDEIQVLIHTLRDFSA
jgi:HPt (histidine-containing phosphotransfer) domain-containing protein